MSQLSGIKGTLTFGNEDEISIPELTDMRELTLMVGANGVGKTLILKTVWFVTYSLEIYNLFALMGIPADQAFQEEVPKIFKATYDADDKFGCDLIIKGERGSSYKFRLVIKDSKLADLSFDIDDPEKFAAYQVGMPKFNSKQARTFNSYEQYLQLLKMHNVDSFKSHDEALKVKNFFKLYDILWFEGIRQKIRDIDGIPENDIVRRGLELVEDGAIDMEGFTHFEAEDEVPYVVFENGKKKKLSSLGAGTQAMLMMAVFG